MPNTQQRAIGSGMKDKYTIRDAILDVEKTCKAEGKNAADYPYAVSVWRQTGFSSGRRIFFGMYKTDAGARRVLAGLRDHKPIAYDLNKEAVL